MQSNFTFTLNHKHDKNIALNCFFKSSDSLNLSDYVINPVTGKKSIAVPGEFKCLETAYKFARFYWKTLSGPAIALARNGFPVSEALAMQLEKIQDKIRKDPILAGMYLDKNGLLVKQNAIIKNERLASTLEFLVSNEADFYDGEIGSNIVDKVRTLTVFSLNFKPLNPSLTGFKLNSN